MRFETIQEFITKFDTCPFCKGKPNVKLGGNYSKQTNQYVFTEDTLEIFIGSRDSTIASISLADNKVTSFIEMDLFPNLFYRQGITLYISCDSVHCKMKGCSFAVKSREFYLETKALKVFPLLLASYVVSVPLEKSQAEYAYNYYNNKTRLTLFTYKPLAYKNDSTYEGNKPGNWMSPMDNSIGYKQQKLVSFHKDLPPMSLEQLANKDNLISKAKVLVTFS